MKQILSALTLLVSGFAYAAAPQFGPVDTLIVNDESAPVPAKNINEPGREPYNQYIEFTQVGCQINCTDHVMFGSVLLFNGPAVPAGKRLVVRWVSGLVPSDTQFNSISFQDTAIIANQSTQWQYYGPYFATNAFDSSWGMSSGAFFTVEPGEPLRIRIRAGSINNAIGSITVGGYLIDAE